MKKNADRVSVRRTDRLALGLAASSASLVTAVCAARAMGGPLAASVGVGLAALAAILLFVFRDRSPAPQVEAPAEQDGAVEALAAL